MLVTVSKLTVSNEELRTVREAMRDLKRILEAFDRGELEKVVLMEKMQMRAVIVPIEGYAALRARPRQDGGLGGSELAAEAARVLEENGVTGDHRGMHYLELLKLVEESTGKPVRGADPGATLLANIDREPRIRSAQSRSGRYVLA
jgi:hypothetical protein